jgi:hypothetical protein
LAIPKLKVMSAAGVVLELLSVQAAPVVDLTPTVSRPSPFQSPTTG